MNNILEYSNASKLISGFFANECRNFCKIFTAGRFSAFSTHAMMRLHCFVSAKIRTTPLQIDETCPLARKGSSKYADRLGTQFHDSHFLKVHFRNQILKQFPRSISNLKASNKPIEFKIQEIQPMSTQRSTLSQDSVSAFHGESVGSCAKHGRKASYRALRR